MTLTTNNPWSSKAYGPGIFINEVTILEAEDISGTVPIFMQEPVDIGIKLTLDVGRDFQYPIRVELAGHTSATRTATVRSNEATELWVGARAGKLAFRGTPGESPTTTAAVASGTPEKIAQRSAPATSTTHVTL